MKAYRTGGEKDVSSEGTLSVRPLVLSLHCGRPGLPRFEEASVIDGQHPRPGPSSAKVFDSNVSPARDGGNVFVTCVEVGTTSQPPGIRHVSRIQLTLRGEERHPSILGPEPSGAFQRIQLFLLARSLLHERFPLQRFIFHAESLGAERVETCSLPA